METIGEIFSKLFDVWKEMFSTIWEILPRALSFFFWVLVAIVILPCVFVAGNIYPKWVEWGEGL